MWHSVTLTKNYGWYSAKHICVATLVQYVLLLVLGGERGGVRHSGSIRFNVLVFVNHEFKSLLAVYTALLLCKFVLIPTKVNKKMSDSSASNLVSFFVVFYLVINVFLVFYMRAIFQITSATYYSKLRLIWMSDFGISNIERLTPYERSSIQHPLNLFSTSVEKCRA